MNIQLNLFVVCGVEHAELLINSLKDTYEKSKFIY